MIKDYSGFLTFWIFMNFGSIADIRNSVSDIRAKTFAPIYLYISLIITLFFYISI